VPGGLGLAPPPQAAEQKSESEAKGEAWVNFDVKKAMEKNENHRLFGFATCCLKHCDG